MLISICIDEFSLLAIFGGAVTLRLIDCLSACLLARLVDWLIGWLVDRLIG